MPSSVATSLGEHHLQPIRRRVRNMACIGPQQLDQRIPLDALSFCTTAKKHLESISSCKRPSQSLEAKAMTSGAVAKKMGSTLSGCSSMAAEKDCEGGILSTAATVDRCLSSTLLATPIEEAP